MTSQYVQHVRWIKMPWVPQARPLWMKLTELLISHCWWYQLHPITINYPAETEQDSCLLQILSAFATRSFTLSSCMLKPFRLVYILLSLVLDHFGSREREAYRITFCDSLQRGELCTTRSRLAKPLWNISAVPTSWHHNPEDQNNMSLLVFGINRRQMMRKGL